MNAERIDAHQHFWRYGPDYAWIGDRMSVLRRDFVPDDLAPLLRGSGLSGSVAVQARQSMTETQDLLAFAKQHAAVRGVVGWIDLCSIEAERQLDSLSDEAALVGIRHVVQDEPDDRFLLREDFQRGVDLLEARNLAYDILIYPRQLPAAIEFVRRFPNHRLVLDHMAKPDIAGGALEPWAKQIRVLARAENVFCKVSGLVTEANWSSWKPGDFSPYLEVVLEAFGPRRLMVGSDWPVCTLAASYGQVMGIAASFFAPLSSEEKSAVFGGNAAGFYRLPKPTCHP
ncbi:MAG: amidohydrolase family protein [Deltaproteobacteria bacterium]|nr:amidohydrolase family protein [Deltaproteobacteria bacterium]